MWRVAKSYGGGYSSAYSAIAGNLYGCGINRRIDDLTARHQTCATALFSSGSQSTSHWPNRWSTAAAEGVSLEAELSRLQASEAARTAALTKAAWQHGGVHPADLRRSVDRRRSRTSERRLTASR